MSNIEYLATPYSHEDKEVMEFRAAVSDYIFSELSKEGRIIYAPISSGHHIAVHYGLPTDYKFWQKACEAFVGASYKLLVIMLPGWEESVGLTAEREVAHKLGLEIEFIDPTPYIMNNEELKTNKFWQTKELAWKNYS